MWWLLWGFFMFCGGGFILSKIKYPFGFAQGEQKSNIKYANHISKIFNSFRIEITQSEIVLVVFFFVSLGLLIFPEFLYFKDIYPAHFRSNTMFKLGYQAFMMLSIVSVYGIISLMSFPRKRESSLYSKLDSLVKPEDDKRSGMWKIVFFIFLVPQVFLVSIFPLFSVRSYFNSLRTYESLDGMGWMRRQYPDDAKAIEWLNREVVSRQSSVVSYADSRKLKAESSIVLLESDGDSYTDYARMSVFTGIPTVVGWPVHEWLWRGSYDVVAPRRADVARIYETTNISEARTLLSKYAVTHVVVGSLERQKYPNLFESKFLELGTKVFESGLTTVYRL